MRKKKSGLMLEHKTQKRLNNMSTRSTTFFDHLSELIHEDKKDALGMTIQNFKKWVVKQWAMMGDADADIVLHTIKDPATVYL